MCVNICISLRQHAQEATVMPAWRAQRACRSNDVLQAMRSSASFRTMCPAALPASLLSKLQHPDKGSPFMAWQHGSAGANAARMLSYMVLIMQVLCCPTALSK